MIERITPADIMAAVNKYLTGENRTVAVMSPAVRISGKDQNP